MSEEQPHVRVTLDVIYQELMKMKADVADLKAASTAATVADHETRIRNVERQQWRWAGAAAAAGAGISTVINRIVGVE